MAVILDIINGATAAHHIVQGWAITRLAVITDIDADTTPEALAAALTQLIAVTGDRGAACPDIPVPTYLEQFIPEMVTTTVVRVRILYKGLPASQFEIETCLSSIETNRAVDGTPIIVGYTYPATDSNPTLAGQHKEVGKPISSQVPESTFTYKFVLLGGVDGMTAWEAVTYLSIYVGKTNNAPYKIGSVVAAKHQLLCSKLMARSNDGAISFQVELSFQLRAARGTYSSSDPVMPNDSWDPWVFYTRPDTGLPPADLTSSGYEASGHAPGQLTVQTIPDIDFPTISANPN